MQIADNILRAHLKNVCFILGSGKTTAANAIARLRRCAVYHTDDRARHFALASPEYQPEMCRDVPDYWALEPDDARKWESAIVREMTPMIIADLVALAAVHELVICEGDICAEMIAPIATNAVCIVNNGDHGDFFDRPDQKHMLDAIVNSDLDREEKRRRIENAYKIIGEPSSDLPREITELGMKRIDRCNTSTPEGIAGEILAYIDSQQSR